MNDQEHAEQLDRFLNGDLNTPSSPEQALAAAIRQAAEAERAPSDYKRNVEAALRAKMAGEKVIEWPLDHGRTHTDDQPGWRRLPTPSPTLSTAVAAMVAMVIALMWLLPQNGDRSLATTPVRERMANPLQLQVGAHITGYDGGERRALDIAGMTWAAYTIVYEPDQAATLLDQADAIRAATHAQARSLMVSVREGDNGHANIEDFVVELAALGVDAVEVLPEANLARGSLIEPADYVQLLTDIRVKLDDLDAETWLISGAPAPTGAEAAFPGQVINSDTYYRELAYAGIEEVVDCIGVKYREGAVPPYAFSGDNRDNYHTRYLPTMLLTTRQYYSNSPLCLTQVGYMVGEAVGYLSSAPQAFGWANNTTTVNQAEWTGDMIHVLGLLQEEHDVQVEMAFVYRLSQTDDPIGQGYVLLDQTGDCAACEAISQYRNDRFADLLAD